LTSTWISSPGALSLVAVGRLRRLQARALAQPDPVQPPRDRRERHVENLGDLRRRHPQSPQSLDCVQALSGQPRGHLLGGGAAIQESGISLSAPAVQPLAGRALADAGGLGRHHQRPVLLFDALDQQLAAVRAGAGVSVDLHPVSSLLLGGSTPPAFKEARMNNVVRNYI
jgi:hypothetical protein